ncbi:hypothetical protein B0H19DRAFT_1134211 [Mycena capillaripes]|nr:hypothetical protein B0H19DRAFT_1134211 [Mycena capillaripes]
MGMLGTFKVTGDTARSHQFLSHFLSTHRSSQHHGTHSAPCKEHHQLPPQLPPQLPRHLWRLVCTHHLAVLPPHSGLGRRPGQLLRLGGREEQPLAGVDVPRSLWLWLNGMLARARCVRRQEDRPGFAHAHAHPREARGRHRGHRRNRLPPRRPRGPSRIARPTHTRRRRRRPPCSQGYGGSPLLWHIRLRHLQGRDRVPPAATAREHPRHGAVRRPWLADHRRPSHAVRMPRLGVAFAARGGKGEGRGSEGSAGGECCSVTRGREAVYG